MSMLLPPLPILLLPGAMLLPPLPIILLLPLEEGALVIPLEGGGDSIIIIPLEGGSIIPLEGGSIPLPPLEGGLLIPFPPLDGGSLIPFPPLEGGMDPPFDGGMDPPFDGGMDPPLDGGIEPPLDGGMDPPLDGGMDPPLEGGMDPPLEGGLVVGGLVPPFPLDGGLVVGGSLKQQGQQSLYSVQELSQQQYMSRLFWSSTQFPKTSGQYSPIPFSSNKSSTLRARCNCFSNDSLTCMAFFCDDNSVRAFLSNLAVAGKTHVAKSETTRENFMVID